MSDHPKDSIKVGLAMDTFHPLSCARRVLRISFSTHFPPHGRLDLNSMPLLRKLPTGHTVRSSDSFFHTYDADETNIQSLGFTEGYHFHPSRSNKKIMKLTARIPDNESLSNPRYIAVEEKFTRTRTSLAVHDCRVTVGKDMYVVTGYWDDRAVANRSVFYTTGQVWRGEIMVICAGRYIPYKKRAKNGPAANTAVKL